MALSVVGTRIVVGLNDFSRVAARIPADVQERLERAGEHTIRRARPLTPVRTGRLRDSPRLSIGELVVVVFWSVFYAPFQEFGTRRGVPARRFAQTAAGLEMKALVADLAAMGSRL